MEEHVTPAKELHQGTNISQQHTGFSRKHRLAQGFTWFQMDSKEVEPVHTKNSQRWKRWAELLTEEGRGGTGTTTAEQECRRWAPDGVEWGRSHDGAWVQRAGKKAGARVSEDTWKRWLPCGPRQEKRFKMIVMGTPDSEKHIVSCTPDILHKGRASWGQAGAPDSAQCSVRCHTGLSDESRLRKFWKFSKNFYAKPNPNL